jgi:hypothetical protein
VQRKAMNAYKADVAATFDGVALRAGIDAAIGPTEGVQAFELAFARAVTQWTQAEADNAERIDLALRYAAWAAHTAAGKAAHRGGVLFRAPRKLDPLHLVPVRVVHTQDVAALELAQDGGHALRRREGFGLTDRGTDFVGGLEIGLVAAHHVALAALATDRVGVFRRQRAGARTAAFTMTTRGNRDEQTDEAPHASITSQIESFVSGFVGYRVMAVSLTRSPRLISNSK